MRSLIVAIAALSFSSLAFAQAASAPQKPCFPKEFGGTGVNYTPTELSNGTIYTQWCKVSGTWVGEFAVSHANKIKPVMNAREGEMEWNRLRTDHGYARDVSTFLVKEAQAQLAATKPK